MLTTVSDRKTGVSSGGIGSLIDYYEPDIVSANDYYPFGMTSRVGLSTKGVHYRYGFNGKENDWEEKGWQNQQDYGMRIYDPRVGRFLSVDPLKSKFPYYSTYQFGGNSPIKFIDLDGLEPSEPDQEKYKGKVYAINQPYEWTGGDDEFFNAPQTKDLGSYAVTVDKSKFFANNTKDKLKRYVNTNDQFLLTNEKAFKTEQDLVNYLLGTFIWGTGPENIVFPENGTFSTLLKGSVAVGEVLVKWAKNDYKDKVYGWSMGGRGELNVDMNSGVTSLEHFLGSVAIKIEKVDDKQIQVEIFNITSFVSGYLTKDIPVVNWFTNTPESTVRSPLIRENYENKGVQPTYSNTSQYFKFTMSTSEADKLIKRFNNGALPTKK